MSMSQKVPYTKPEPRAPPMYDPSLALVEQPVLNCPLLRDAVYRNRTSSRALRHNIALSCVSVAMLPAVAPWLPPWDVVPPEAALRGLRSLEIVQRWTDPPRSQRKTSKQAQHLLLDLAYCMERIAPQLAGVTSLTLRFPSTLLIDNCNGGEVLRRILRCLPALQSLTLPCTEKHLFVHAKRDEDVHGVMVGAPGEQYVEHAPRLTALDTRHSGDTYLFIESANTLLMKSLVCSRLSLRTIVTQARTVVSSIASEYKGTTPRLATDRPRYTPFTPEEVKEINAKTTGGRAPVRLLKLHSPAWTLRSFIFESISIDFRVSDMCRFVVACPVLRSMKLVATLGYVGEEWKASHPFEERKQTAAHAAVLRVAAAVREQHPALRGMAPAHAASLAAMVSEEQYPATLSLVFARGFDLTTLERVDVHGAVGAEHGAIDAAVEAARLLRQWKQGQ